MYAEQSDWTIKKALKSLCCNNGWSYGVFWRFDNRNSLLLTMQDAYYNEEWGVVIDDMYLQVHMLGGGIIGQAAFTKKHRWMFSDAHYKGQNFVGSVGRCDASQDDSEFHHQFASGIKTIVVIPVEPNGVLQFGSTQKITEGTEFVNQTKRVFRETTNFDGLNLPENPPSSLNYGCDGSSRLFASLISSGNTKFSDIKFQQGAGCQDLMETCSSVNPIQSLSFTSDHRKMNPALSHCNNQLQSAGTESQVMISSNFNTQLQKTPCSSTWSSGDSTLTSIKHQPSELRSQASDNLFPVKPERVVSYRNSIQNFQDPTFTSLDSTQRSSEILMNQQHSTIPLHEIVTEPIFEEFMEAANYTTDHFKSSPMDSFYQWFDPSLHQSNGTDLTTLSDDLLSEATRLVSAPYNFNGADSPIILPVNHPANSVQSSITNTSHSNGKEKFSNLFKAEHDPFDNFGYGQAEHCDDILMPVKTGSRLNFSNDTSECLSEQHVSSSFGHRKRLFSKLGIEQLIEDISGTSSSVTRTSFEDQLSSTYKRMKTGSSLGSSDQVQIAGHPCFGRKVNTFQQQKVDFPKLDSGSWVSDKYGLNVERTGLQHKTHATNGKPVKKKTKPGARPRPKDRQQIQDRLSELRELIPKGEKMSIDCLLDRTIKYMLFLQSVTKHADTLKQANETKDNEMVQNNNSGSRGDGVTWACEFLDQSVVCPLLIEDLSNPGQMLIEMLCEEQGFFLEIVDTVRGFGLTILKGVMEVRENKIWARFTVESEGNRHVSRHEIFSTLVQLLQLTAPNAVDVREQHGNVTDGGTTQQSVVPLPVSLIETLHHASL